jgi:cardiolipin synthase
VYRLRRGNDVTVLRGAEPFPAMLAAIAAAKRSILLETYIFEDDTTGLKFVAALVERASAGVEVRLIFDAIGTFGMDGAHVDRMRAAGVQVIEYHPIAPWRARFNLSHRDHRKILVVDDDIGFMGGINLSDDYAPLAAGGRGWHDVHCSLRGPVVADMARIFRRTWLDEGGAEYPAPEPAETRPTLPANIAARVVDNTRRKRRGAIRRAYLAAINAARNAVLIENAYFLPDRALRRAMARAVERGCEVSVIVPGRSDVRTVEYAGLYIYRWFAERGIRILRWKGPMMHAKTAVVDAMWATIGSYNLDARSLRFNLEVIVEIIDGDVGAGMEKQFRLDEASTVPYDLATWRSFAWWRKALAWLAFRFRSWL